MTEETRRCICGHYERDHLRIDAADTVTAGFIDPAVPPQVMRVMRSYCNPDRRRWGSVCKCVLYTPTTLLAEQFARGSG